MGKPGWLGGVSNGDTKNGGVNVIGCYQSRVCMPLIES